jgi:hypothetical protein
MFPVTHQTIKLSKGRHASPEDGACVMELASMLAGEQFTDRPTSVCPVIGSLLRSYDDSIDDARRRSMYECASNVVGSRASARVQHLRARRLVAWTEEMQRRQRTRFLLHSPLRALRRFRKPPIDAIGSYAVESMQKDTDETHAAVLGLIDELLKVGRRDERVSARVIAARTRTLDASH